MVASEKQGLRTHSCDLLFEPESGFYHRSGCNVGKRQANF